MTRRFATALGAVAASILLAAVPTFAHAAVGYLGINGTMHMNPSQGCMKFADAPTFTEIYNRTDAVVSVYPTTDCTGDPVRTVLPNSDSGQIDIGASAMVHKSPSDG
ncbi:hypothetical protein [Streptomyces microflavus]|uniref:Secreted protein n=1 Tax=Streptomyces microflavus TaxID=1919 RepID=A0A7H8MYB7_STRMI|nr:hypothetical protein [Streptomyces microflavus]QKW47143.1 hypothetical protein HUT09_33940 [Streptomyces microflavus]